MLGTHNNSIRELKQNQIIKDQEEMREWNKKCQKEKAFRAKIKAEYRQQFEITLAAKLKKMEAKNGNSHK